MNKAPEWLVNAIADGIQRLYALHLEGRPPLETIEGCAVAWTDAFMSWPIGWDEAVDKDRISKAFIAGSASFERWPSPVMVRRLLPERPEPVALPPPRGAGPSPAIKARIKSMIVGMKARS